MVGASADDFAEAQPLFEVVGKTVVHVGPSGSGQTVKAANQLIVAANIQAVSEAVIFLEAYGVDTKAALEVLGGGLAGSAGTNPKKENTISRSFQPGSPTDPHPQDPATPSAAAPEAGATPPPPSPGARPGTTGVCMGTRGPAGPGMIAGLSSGAADSIPTLCITGQARVAKLRKEDFQGGDIASIAKPVAKWAVTVMEPAQVPGTFQ